MLQCLELIYGKGKQSVIRQLGQHTLKQSIKINLSTFGLEIIIRIRCRERRHVWMSSTVKRFREGEIEIAQVLNRRPFAADIERGQQGRWRKDSGVDY